MSSDVSACTAFISYSWENESHKEWVRALASRLRGDGVDVTLDQWHAVPGDQLPEFMEKSVRNNRFVLIVCTPHYKTRAEKRVGGVGYEGDIITAEVLTTRNQRKFIPILRKGSWMEAAPSWLTGKYFVDLSGASYSEKSYQDLSTTLLGTRAAAPPLGQPAKALEPRSSSTKSSPGPGNESAFEPIEILGVIAEEVGTPRNDGTRGSALYEVPFRLSCRPPHEWADLFVHVWDHPPRFTTAHRPGIARVVGDKVILDGTTLDEVERYHRDTLLAVLERVNDDYLRYQLRQKQQDETREQQFREHEAQVQDIAHRLKFD